MRSYPNLNRHFWSNSTLWRTGSSATLNVCCKVDVAFEWAATTQRFQDASLCLEWPAFDLCGSDGHEVQSRFRAQPWRELSQLLLVVCTEYSVCYSLCSRTAVKSSIICKFNSSDFKELPNMPHLCSQRVDDGEPVAQKCPFQECGQPNAQSVSCELFPPFPPVFGWTTCTCWKAMKLEFYYVQSKCIMWVWWKDWQTFSPKLHLTAEVPLTSRKFWTPQ